MSKKKKCNPEVMRLLCEKSSTKQKVFRMSKEYFGRLKKVVEEISLNLESEMCRLDDSVKISFKDKNPHECELQFSGDTLLFSMHTNIFTFDDSHRIWNSGYLREDRYRGYFGMFHIYNFLSDSLRFDRIHDLGVLIARVFVNKDGHFFVEGKRQLGYIYNHLADHMWDEESMKKIVDAAIIYTLEYDLTVPDYRDVMQVSVQQMKEMSDELHLKTAKKVELGYYSRMQKQ